MKNSSKYKRTRIAGIVALLLLTGCKDTASVLTSEETSGAYAEEEGDQEGTNEKNVSDTKEEAEETEMIYVDVQGAVSIPGVYLLPAGSRIFQAIEMAGGANSEAAVELVNQAGILEDGQQIRIYTVQEAEELKKKQTLVNPGDILSDGGNGTGTGGKVDLNRADKSALMTLTGIGETRAEAILAYRNAHGGFSCIEDLMQVEGIKEKTYEKLKDEITVN